MDGIVPKNRILPIVYTIMIQKIPQVAVMAAGMNHLPVSPSILEILNFFCA
jgi:hypothetical protein